MANTPPIPLSAIFVPDDDYEGCTGMIVGDISLPAASIDTISQAGLNNVQTYVGPNGSINIGMLWVEQTYGVLWIWNSDNPPKLTDPAKIVNQMKAAAVKFAAKTAKAKVRKHKADKKKTTVKKAAAKTSPAKKVAKKAAAKKPVKKPVKKPSTKKR